jgi:hypothetical protein
MTRPGWFKESRRHALAAQGVKTGHYKYQEPLEIITSDDKHYAEGDYWYNKKGQVSNEKSFGIARKLAIAIASKSDNQEVFKTTFHQTQNNAEQKALELNKVLEGTGAKADWEMGANYNMRGTSYMVVIHGYTPAAEKKLMSRFKFSENDLESYD